MFARPLTVCALSLVIGVGITGSREAVTPPVVVALVVAAAICVGALVTPRARKRPALRVVIAAVSFLFTGLALGATVTTHSVHPPEIVDRETPFEGTVREQPRVSGGREHVVVDAARAWVDGAQRLVRAGVQVTVREGTTALREGDRVRFICRPHLPHSQGSPGAADTARIFARHGVSVACTVAAPDDIVLTQRGGSASPAHLVRGWRASVNAALARDVEGTPGAILRALVTGDTGSLAQETRDAFSLAGMAHILVISGLHTSMVAHLFYLLALAALLVVPRLPLRVNAPRLAAGAAVLFVWTYAIFAGAAPSTVRAAIMTTAFLAALVIGRDPDLPSSIALAAIAILAWNPADLFEGSFQLSFASVIAIAAICPVLVPETARDPLAPYRRWRPARWIWSFMAVTIAATVGTAPLVARVFNQFSVVAPLANLAAVPLATYLIVPGGLVAAALYGLWPAAGTVVAKACGGLCTALDWIARGAAALPGAYFYVSTPTVAELVLFWAAVAILIWGGRRRPALVAAAVCLAAAAAVWAVDARSHRHAGELEVTFVDVGQGDCIFATLPDGTTMLVDAGGVQGSAFDTGRSIVAPYLYHRRLTRLDFVVLTHPHADHMNGLLTIVERFRPRTFMTTAEVLATPAARPLIDKVRSVGARVATVNAASAPMSVGGATVEFLGPPPGGGLTENDGSIVARLSFGGRRFLLTGDIQEPGERAVLSSGRPVDANVLKAAHHGSMTSNNPPLLDAVKPTYAVISAGSHSPRHFPHKDVLERLAERRIAVLRTDLHGTITFVTGGAFAPACFRNDCK